MSWWIGTYFGHLVNLCDAVYVEADSEPEAAQAIVDWFASEDGIAIRSNDGRGDLVEVETVFVIPADDYAVYDVGLTAIGRSPLQCCGGSWSGGSDHSGHCPVVERGDE